MICKHCGKSILPKYKICPYCNNSLDSDSDDIFSSSQKKEPAYKVVTSQVQKSITTKQRKLKPQIKNALIFSAAILVLVFVLSILGVFKTKAQKVCDYLEKGNYDSAYNLYQEEFKDKESPRLISALIDYMGEAYSDYTDDKISLEEISKSFETIKKMDIPKLESTIELIEEKIEGLSKSADYFKKGEKYYDEQKYDKAIKAYRKVVEDDENYETASLHLKKSIQNYRNSALSEASDLALNGSYSAAVDVLDTALDVLKKDELIEKRRDEYEKSGNKKTLKNINDAIDACIYKENYAGAIEVIANAMKEDKSLKKNKTLNKNLKYYREKYAEQFTTELSELKKDKNYSAAADLIQKAEKLLPNNQNVLYEKNQIKDKLPTLLDELKPLESESWNFSHNSAIDSFGVEHKDDDNRVVLTENSSATYDVSDFEELTLYAVAGRDMTGKKATLKISATLGGEYLLREVKIKPSYDAQYIEFIVEDCEKLSFSVEGAGAEIILYNLELKK